MNSTHTLKLSILDYIQSYLQYSLNSLIKLKLIYKHFIQKTTVQVTYRLFRETLMLILRQLNAQNREICIVRKNNTYYLQNMNFITNVQEEKQKFIQLAQSFYHLENVALHPES
nr:hypothetical protein [Halimeda borneensis]